MVIKQYSPSYHHDLHINQGRVIASMHHHQWRRAQQVLVRKELLDVVRVKEIGDLENDGRFQRM